MPAGRHFTARLQMQATVADKHMHAFVLCRVLLQVCQWVFGQEFPGPESPVAQQAFAVVTAMVGLCAFALVLALVEQVVLEGMEANVKRGSRVYEAGHVSAGLVAQRGLPAAAR
jgi:hypothetical protein